MTTQKTAFKILNVTDMHIGAPYGGVALSPESFLQIARTLPAGATLDDFVKKAGLPADSPLGILAAKIKDADAIALTGDVIEFINQPAACDDEMMLELGIEFHHLLLASANGKPVYEVLGNHERVKRYEKALEFLEDAHENFHVNASHFLIGDALFIHGDIDLTPYSMEGERAYEKRDRERMRHPVDHWRHNFQNRHVPPFMSRSPRLHAALEKILSPIFEDADSLLYTPQNQVAVMFHNLSSRLGEHFSKVKHVFLGHTHIPYTNLTYRFRGREVNFHNSGTTYSGNNEDFRPLMITIKDGAVTDIEQFGLKNKSMGAAR